MHKLSRKFPYFRILILVTSTVAMTFAFANPIVLNFTIICMTHDAPGEIASGNTSGVMMPALAESIQWSQMNASNLQNQERWRYHWTVKQKSTALSAYAWGATAVVLPLSSLTQKFGARPVFFVASMISSLATILCPMVANTGIFAIFIFARIAQGFGFAAVLPMLGAMAARWSTTKETAQFLALGTCCMQFATIMSMPIGGMACVSDYGWPLAFYLIGTIGSISTVLWVLVYSDCPRQHPLVTEEEVSKIMQGKIERHSNAKYARNIPYRSIFRSPPVWAIIIGTFGNLFGLMLIITYMPTYLHRVMNFDFDRIGFLSAAPHIGHALVKTLAGILSDKAKCNCGFKSVNKIFYMRLYNTIATIGMAVCYAGLAFVTPSDGSLALALFIGGASVLGFQVGSLFKSAALVGQIFSGYMMGLVKLATCAVIFVVPYVVGEMTKSGTAKEWTHVFALTAALLVATNFVFCVFGSDEPAEWSVGHFKMTLTSTVGVVADKAPGSLEVAPLSPKKASPSAELVTTV